MDSKGIIVAQSFGSELQNNTAAGSTWWRTGSTLLYGGELLDAEKLSRAINGEGNGGFLKSNWDATMKTDREATVLNPVPQEGPVIASETGTSPKMTQEVKFSR